MWEEVEESGTTVRKLSSELPLPTYMCPAIIIPLGNLPTTTSGKRDRAALDAILISPSRHRITAQELVDWNYLTYYRHFPHWQGCRLLSSWRQFNPYKPLFTKYSVSKYLAELFQANTLRSMASSIAANMSKIWARSYTIWVKRRGWSKRRIDQIQMLWHRRLKRRERYGEKDLHHVE